MSSVVLHEVQLSMGNVLFGVTCQDVFYSTILVIISFTFRNCSLSLSEAWWQIKGHLNF